MANLAAVAVYVAYVRGVERRRAVELGATGAARESGAGFGIGAALVLLTIGVMVAIGVERIDAGAGLAAIAPAFVVVCAGALSETVVVARRRGLIVAAFWNRARRRWIAL